MSWQTDNLNHGQTIHPTENFISLNSLSFNKGIIFLDPHPNEGCWKPKLHPEAEIGMKELIYWKKFLTKVAQQPQKPLYGLNQIWAMISS